ncbi:MAG: PSD1 and planctomycete cytochrome C domain-containing protein [Verrucomicrobia bacterium]|nr:PSD1 and planctomycete cytochrome C domain-containing protein [Verrucomicrobiota bacterium]
MSRCQSCHGPERQRGGYRLDSRAAALAGGDAYRPAIRPGDSAGSPLVHLVAGLVPDSLMPARGEPLTQQEVALLRAWVDAGVPWPEDAAAEPAGAEPHWAFQPVVRPPVPAPPHPAGDQDEPPGEAEEVPSNPIDAFIQEKLAEHNLGLSPEADPVTLLRRLYLVMLGVPPTPEEVAAFMADPRPDAFERWVDRALDDPRYGERWARHWLDLVRFAESNGFETNRERPHAWRFRDYVIDAFNRDVPYDRFVREQLAGDAFGADVATGFLVAGPVDIVGSPDPVLTAQQRADELDDMVSTTGTAFLGLTVGCARCHAHKFDPIAQREYYALAAVFSGVKHSDRALPLPAAQAGEVVELDRTIHELERRLARFLVPAASQTNQVADAPLRPPVNARHNEELFPPLAARFIRFTILAASSGEPCLDELEVWSAARNVALARYGTKSTASGTLPGYEIHQLKHVNDGQFGNAHSWISDKPGRGWVQLELPRVERIERIVWGRDREGAFGDRVPTKYRIEAALEPGAWVVLATSDDREPFPGPAPKSAEPEYRFAGWPEAEAAQGREWLAELEQARRRRTALAQPPMAYAGTFVEPGLTFRLHRGDPMQPREVVAPGTLSVFQPLTLATNTPEQERRLRLAEWVTHPKHPLTARVLVNRIWQHHFGVGLVDTPNDFGRNGARPTHPALLDWLASELVHPTWRRSRREEAQQSLVTSTPTVPAGWSLKHLHRLILTSATWRQSSAPRPEALAVDAGCRWLWRFPPRRLEAEAIRDSALAVSGTLDPTPGGPGFFLHRVERENVYHYHPLEDFGPAESRRMVYAVKIRLEPDGIFGAFDCPDGSLAIPRRNVSTTPLQALNLFNSRFIADQAIHLAARLEREAGPEPQAQVRRAWQLAFLRPPDPTEINEAAALIQTEGLPALARALLNANEFLFIP